METPTREPIKIAAIGMDQHAREILKMAFLGPGKGHCKLVEENTASIFIFNMDCVGANEMWEQYNNEYPNHPFIVMSVKDPQIEGVRYFEKPLRIEQLLDAIYEIQEQSRNKQREDDKNDAAASSRDSDIQPAEQSLPSSGLEQASMPLEDLDEEKEFCGSNPDFDLNNAEVLAKIYYKPNDHLEEQILNAYRTCIEEKVAVKLTVKVNDKWESITFLPVIHSVLTTLSDLQVRNVCSAPKYCTEVKLHRHSPEETQALETAPQTKTSSQAAEQFLWKVALWTSRGRVPAGTDLNIPVKLMRWPNFTRLQQIPNAMRIATLLIDEARPLNLVTKVLDVPQRHVFAFYSATRALSLSSMQDGKVPNKKAHEGAKQHKHHNLLGRLLKRLSGGVATT